MDHCVDLLPANELHNAECAEIIELSVTSGAGLLGLLTDIFFHLEAQTKINHSDNQAWHELSALSFQLD